MTVVTGTNNVVESPYRWMDQKVQIRAEAAACRFEILENLITAEINRILSSSESPDLQSFVGRVLSESSEDIKDPKLPLNPHSIILESSSGKYKVKLFLHESPDYILFPGQIVGAIGRLMGGGREMHAQKLICGAPVPPPAVIGGTPPSAAVHVAIASGPYSPENMLIFDSISELEARVRSENAPDVLVLMGPFLDVNHPAVSSGIILDSFNRPATFEDIYREEIIPKLARLARACENARTELYIVPSIHEARISIPLPQPPINSLRGDLWQFLVKELPPTVRYLSNPSFLRVGDMDMYVTSADGLSAINSNVLFKQSTEEGALGRVDACLDQFLRSRSVFPVNPCGVRIEPSERYRLELGDQQLPHIIVSPSLAGKRFVKKVSGRIFVNPGFMSDAAGTTSCLAELVISPPSGDSGNVSSRISGDVIKL
jgi:DNA polymerase alpha subunit B